jgi:hypothetical protein
VATRKTRRIVSEEAKRGAIDKIRAGAKRADVAKEIGVSVATINSWMAASGGMRGQKSKTGPADELELMRLELDFLRKKVAYYERKYG